MRISRRELLGVIPAGLRAASQEKLNFILILSDDLGWADLACYGNRLHETPNLDRLAREGARFSNAYAAAPVCSPTRASVLTGKYPARLRLTNVLPGDFRRSSPNDRWVSPTIERGLPPQHATIAEALKPAGYKCACIGKWHLGPEEFAPVKRGFDVSVGGNHIGGVIDYFYPAWAENKYPPSYPIGPAPIGGSPGQYLTDRLTEEALKFLDANKDDPFFLLVSHYGVHTPIQAKSGLTRKYDLKRSRTGAPGNPAYAAMLESVDESVGTLLSKINKLGIADRTVILFTSDNGGLTETAGGEKTAPTSNFPLRAGKGTLYEGGIRVPLIARWPRVISPGSVCDVPVSSVDFFPTIASNSTPKAKIDRTVDGLNLASLFAGAGRSSRDELYWHYPHYFLPRVSPAAAVRHQEWKLLHHFEDNRFELFNLVDDASEKSDLSTREPGRVARLRGMLRDWQATVRAQSMTPNHEYKSK